MDTLTKLFKDNLSAGNCCSMLYRGVDRFVLQGKIPTEADMAQLGEIGPDETAVAVEANVFERLLLGARGTGNDGDGQAHAETYETLAGPVMSAWSDHLSASAGVQSGHRVIDLACGTGFAARDAFWKSGRNGHVVGIDNDPAMIEIGRRMTGLDLRVGDVSRIGESSCSFDIALCQQGLQYVQDPLVVLKEAYRLLKPGGRVALSVWCDNGRDPRLRGAQLGGPVEIAALLESSGFSDIVSVEAALRLEIVGHDSSPARPGTQPHLSSVVAVACRP